MNLAGNPASFIKVRQTPLSKRCKIRTEWVHFWQKLADINLATCILWNTSGATRKETAGCQTEPEVSASYEHGERRDGNQGDGQRLPYPLLCRCTPIGVNLSPCERQTGHPQGVACGGLKLTPMWCTPWG